MHAITRRSRGTAGLAVSTLLAGLVVTWGVLAPPAAADGTCATPGGSGAGGTLTGVVNTYYPGVGSVTAGDTSLSVGASSGAATPIAAGDLLLVWQVQGADFDSSNTDSYGHGPPPATPASGYTALNGSGSYEYVVATSGVGGGTVSISGLGPGAGLLNDYVTAAATASAGQRRFQVVRVPQYTTATTSSGLTALGWTGAVGGVLALDTTSTLTLAGTVSVDGLGFRGGAGLQRGGAAGLANTDRVTSATLAANGQKAEGIAGRSLGLTTSNGYPGGDNARGAPGNAGGGGTDGRPTANDQNSGGGGGGNGGAGGIGGNTWSSNLPRGGYGGVEVPSGPTRVFLGGGGGAGTANNFPPPAAGGAAGGGVVLMRVGAVAGSGTISANGAAAYNLTANDGAGGGGAGGTVVLTTPSGSLAGATVVANGGRGGNAWATQAGASSAHGPGGGGGGGVVLTSSAPTSTSVTGGANGITTTGNLPYGSAPGSPGDTATVTPDQIPGVSGGAECADLSVTKSGPATVEAEGSLSYTVSVANAGPADATDVEVVDTLPADVVFGSASGTGWTCTNSGNVSVTCTRAALAVGAAPDISVTVTAPAQAGTATNDVSVTAATPDPDPSNNTDTTSTTVTAVADLAIVKSGPATVVAEDTITYDLDVDNLGPSDAVDVEVEDTLPVGVSYVSASGGGWACAESAGTVTCTRPSLAAGASAPTITVTVVAPAQAASLVNSATVSSTTPDDDPDNNSSSVTTTVTPSADLVMSKSGPASVPSAGSLSYTLTVTNDGPSDAADVEVTDTLPPGLTGVTASGAGWFCTTSSVVVTCQRATLAAGASADVVIDATAPTGSATLVNSATVTTTTPDPDPDNDTDTSTTEVGPAADLSLVKVGPAEVAAGAEIRYGIAVTNAGPDAAVDVTVVDVLPDGVRFVSAAGTGWTCVPDADVSVTCERATLAAGATAPLITLVVLGPEDGGRLRNAAEVSSTTYDPDGDNNTASAPTVVRTPDGGLPGTGGPGFDLLVLGLAMILGGAGFMRVSRRRRS